MCGVMTAHAADGDTFTAKSAEGVEMTFKVISETDKTCQLGANWECCLADNSVTGTLTIPANPNGYKLTTIGERAFYEANSLEKIVIPETVTEIDSYAFGYCSSLTTVNLTASLKKLGDFVFRECMALKEVSVPGSIETFGRVIFSECEGLEKATVGEGINKLPESMFSGCIGLTSVSLPLSLQTIGQSAFSSCKSLESIVLPKGLQTIEYAAFEDSGLKTIPFPASLTTIERNAFANSALTEVTIPGTVTTLGDDVFFSCENLVKATLDEGVKVVAEGMFYNCEALTTVNLPSTLTTIESGAFHNTISLVEVTVPEGVTTIGDGAFIFSGLKKITLPSTLTSMTNAFKGSALEEVVIAEGVTDISYWFQDCASLKSIYIPASVTKIVNTFNGCSALETIVVAPDNATYDSRDNCNAIIEKATNTLVRASKNTKIPATVTAIGDGAYYGMTGLGNLDLPQQVTKIGRDAFRASDLSGITLPAALESVGTEAFRETQLTEVVLPDNLVYLSQGMFAECKNLEHVTFGKNTIGIPTSCFVSCTALKEVELPASITFIYHRAFSKSGLKNIQIPESVTIIGESAFEGCRLDELVVEGCGSLSVFTYAFNAWIKHLSFLTTYQNINGCISSSFSPDKMSFQAYMTEKIQYGSSVIRCREADPFIGIRDEWKPYCGSHNNFAVPEGLEAYIVTGIVGDKVQLKQVNSINRDQGVLLHLVDPTKATATIKMTGGDMLRYEAVPLDDDQVTDYSGDNILHVTVMEKSCANWDNSVVQFLFNGSVFEQKELDTLVGLNAFIEDSKDEFGDYQTLSLSVMTGDPVKGDADGNGTADAADAEYIANMILQGKYSSRCDVNKDGKVNAADIVELVNILKK